MVLDFLAGSYSVCRLDPDDVVPEWASSGDFSCVSRTRTELSVVCAADAVPPSVKMARGWRALAVRGPMSVDAVGILAGLTAVLAGAGISVFVVSTYDTDVLLVREHDANRAMTALREAGHQFSNPEDQ